MLAVSENRQDELEARLTEANQQLLERDQETLTILRSRDEEFMRWRELLERELERHSTMIESLNRTIAEMQATRAWRIAVRYRQLRDRVKSTLSARARGA
jgi:uncharacterized protein YhaN